MVVHYCNMVFYGGALLEHGVLWWCITVTWFNMVDCIDARVVWYITAMHCVVQDIALRQWVVYSGLYLQCNAHYITAVLYHRMQCTEHCCRRVGLSSVNSNQPDIIQLIGGAGDTLPLF